MTDAAAAYPDRETDGQPSGKGTEEGRDGAESERTLRKQARLNQNTGSHSLIRWQVLRMESKARPGWAGSARRWRVTGYQVENKEIKAN